MIKVVKPMAGMLAVALCMAAMPAELSAQCAMCRRALQSPEAQQLVAALRSGILILLAAPFLSFGVVAALAVRSQRRASLSVAEPEAPRPNP